MCLGGTVYGRILCGETVTVACQRGRVPVHLLVLSLESQNTPGLPRDQSDNLLHSLLL